MLQRKERTKLVKLEKIAYPKTSSTGLVPRRENKLYAQMPGNLMQKLCKIGQNSRSFLTPSGQQQLID
ncbi:hypothetical protein Y1Q_0016747 [Alligator mississippiensis]|uniref:Uncharacterized protein n=1 Tax=Alligator mississippiensis TaxID=8496 RepID=A0A151P6T2_ALLMI|nr:hypothetical protein Y1Q_0016747 [Alligator mississippiensis]